MGRNIPHRVIFSKTKKKGSGGTTSKIKITFGPTSGTPQWLHESGGNLKVELLM